MAVPMPAVVAVIVCKVVLGQPDDNSQFTHFVPSEWDYTGGVMTCRRTELQLYDPAVDAGADERPFRQVDCMRAGVRWGTQYDIDNWDKPWRFKRFGCPVPIYPDLDADGAPDPGSEIIGWKIPDCGNMALEGLVVCENDTEV